MSSAAPSPGDLAPPPIRSGGPAPQTAVPGGQQPQVHAGRMAEDIAVQMARHGAAGVNRFELRLDPPELGRIDIRMEITADGQVQASLSVDRADALDLLRADARLLDRALNDAGLKTDSGSLSFSLRQDDDRPDAGQGDAQGRETRQGQHGQSGGHGPPAADTPDEPVRSDGAPQEDLHGLRITVRRGVNVEI